MKLYLLSLCGLLCALPLAAQAAETSDAVTIKLGPLTAVPASVSMSLTPPAPPITVVRGAHVQLVIAQPDPATATVQWQKDGHVLAATGVTLDLAAATPADSGVYSAKMIDGGGAVISPYLESVPLLVTTPGQRLQNVSTRARISSNQPFFLTGFVVQPGPGQMRVIVRAVGPTLAAFGVTNALAAPQVQVRDAAGHVIAPVTWLVTGSPLPGTVPPPSTAEVAAESAGAFPLLPGGKDVAQEYWLPAGAYTAMLSSADGGSGTALLEIYPITD